MTPLRRSNPRDQPAVDDARVDVFQVGSAGGPVLTDRQRSGLKLLYAPEGLAINFAFNEVQFVG